MLIANPRDLKANPNDLKAVDELNNNSMKVEIIENMDHILRYYDGNKTIMKLKKQYEEEVDKPLHEELKKLLKDWLKKVI